MSRWPELSADWEETRDALHLYLQVAGKYRLAHTPWVNHSWHATLLPTVRGLTTTPVYDGDETIEIRFDFATEKVLLENADGRSTMVPLQTGSVQNFDREFRSAIRSLGGRDGFHGAPNEIADGLPFAQDTRERRWDGDAVRRFHRALLSAGDVFHTFRTGFIGKATPVHLFWGSFDLAVTLFSGREAPEHPGGVPALPDPITREAYSHEVASAGLWPGGGPYPQAAFYAYAYPSPDGYGSELADVDGASWSSEAGEYILPYEVVRTASDPDALLLRFLQSAFAQAASLGNWPIQTLCRPVGERCEVPRVNEGGADWLR